MRKGNRELIVVGDRMLIRPDKPEDRTEVGLYLPQTAVEKEKIQSRTNGKSTRGINPPRSNSSNY